MSDSDSLEVQSVTADCSAAMDRKDLARFAERFKLALERADANGVSDVDVVLSIRDAKLVQEALSFLVADSAKPGVQRTPITDDDEDNALMIEALLLHSVQHSEKGRKLKKLADKLIGVSLKGSDTA